MPDLPTRLDLFSVGRNYVLSRNMKIDPKQVDTIGSDVNIFCGVGAHMTHQVIKHLGFGMARLYLDGCEGEDLDRYAWDRYQLVRKGASAALVELKFYRSVGGTSGTIPSGTVVATLNGVQYVTTTSATFASSTLSVDKIYARAQQAGKEFQVGRNMVRKFQTLSDIFDQTIQINNDDVSAGGEDVEDDDTFKYRIRSFWRAARRGILAAIEFGALQVPGIVSAQAIEAFNSQGNPARIVTLYVADSSGVASAPLANLVRTSLLDYRAAGITVIVSTSLPEIVDILIKPTFQAGVDTLILTEQIRAAIVEFVNSLPVNGPLYLNDLGAVFRRFKPQGLIVERGLLVTPTGDLIPQVGRTLRTTLNNVQVAA